MDLFLLYMAATKTVRIRVEAQNGAYKSQKASRILIVDSHPVVREGLIYVLQRESDVEVCGQAGNRSQALQLVEATNPRLVVMGLQLKNSEGLGLISDLHKNHPRVQILVVSMHDEAVNAERVIHAGAAGYISKEEPITKILEAIRQVLRGEIYLSQKLSARMVAELAGHPPKVERGSILATLSDRELEIFELLGDGLARRQIAERLHLDVNTIETYRTRLREKLRLKDAPDLLQYAIQLKRDKNPDSAHAQEIFPPYFNYAPVFSETQFRAGFL